MTPATPDDQPGRPLLRVVKGDPTPEEIAALVAVLSAGAVAADASGRGTTSAYGDPAAAHRTQIRVGPGAWVASGRVPGTRTKAQW